MAQDVLSRNIEYRARHTTEPDWLYDLRKRAWDAFQELPLPDQVMHLWKYTKPEQFMPADTDAVIEAAVHALEQQPATNGRALPEGHAAIGYNRSDMATFSHMTDEAAEAGVIVKDLHAAARDHEDLVREHLAAQVGEDFERFEALNLATFSTGLFVYVPGGVTLEQPIYLHRQPGPGQTAARLLVVMGANSEAVVVDDYYTREAVENVSMNSVVEVHAGQSSRLSMVTMTRLGDSDRLLLTHRNELERDAVMNSVSVGTGVGVAKVNWGTRLIGRGAHSEWTGMLLGGGEEHYDVHTRHHHSAGDTWSNLEYKVAAQQKAVSAYTGRIIIDIDARNCEAYQENRNLLLSEDARVESIPELEISNDDVKASHGVTVGMLEPEELFYLTSRGIEPEVATRIILAGFFEKPLEQVPQKLRDNTRTLLLNKLEA